MKVLLTVTALGAAAIALAVAMGAGAHSEKTGTIKVVEHATTDAVADIGKKGDSAGDVLTFANAVFNARNTKKIGTDQGYCLRTAVGKSWECNWTVFLAGGQITVEGPFFDAGDSTLSITGGTGLYREARGSMKLHARNKKGTEYDFVYLLD